AGRGRGGGGASGVVLPWSAHTSASRSPRRAMATTSAGKPFQVSAAAQPARASETLAPALLPVIQHVEHRRSWTAGAAKRVASDSWGASSSATYSRGPRARSQWLGRYAARRRSPQWHRYLQRTPRPSRVALPGAAFSRW